jgi:hypothetical protein
MALIDFNGKGVAPATGNEFDTIPKGEYHAIITKSEVKLTKKGDGQMANFEVQLLDDPYKGRKIFDAINFLNASSEQAEAIGKSRLASLAIACCFYDSEGDPQIVDTTLTHGIALNVKVGIQPAKDGYKEKNTILAYKLFADIVNDEVPALQTTREPEYEGSVNDYVPNHAEQQASAGPAPW